MIISNQLKNYFLYKFLKSMYFHKVFNLNIIFYIEYFMLLKSSISIN